MTAETAKELTAAEALTRLAVFQTHRDPCEDGHVEHTAEDHLGERIVHSISPHGFGADWNEDGARAFIEKAVRIVDLERGSHSLAVFSDDGDGVNRWMRFDTLPAGKAETA
jgi:hypothetical protein